MPQNEAGAPHTLSNCLCVVLDTTKPHISFQGFQGNGKESKVMIDWTIREENPDLDSLRLEYLPRKTLPQEQGRPEAWIPVPVSQALTGRATLPWPPEGVNVRLRMRDKAGNEGQAEAKMGP